MNRSLALRLYLLLLPFMIPAVTSAATYEITFEATWSRDNHPGNYPSNAHFSPIIGATHNSDVELWSIGGIATDGIEEMAETGGTGPLSREIRDAISAGTVMAAIRGAGINSPGSTTRSFDIEPSHSLVSLVTMIAPSPDWFVGVSGLDLRPNGTWVDSITVDLVAYDAGTDSGTAFTSGNLNTTPREEIAVLGAPLGGTPPLGTFTFDLVAVPEPSSSAMASVAALLAVATVRRRRN